MSLLMDSRLHPTANPLWWRIPTWIALTAFTVTQAHGVALRIGAGALMGLSVLFLQFVAIENKSRARVAVVLSVLAAAGACFCSPSGIAEVPIVVAVSRGPKSMDGTTLRWFTGIATVGFGVTVAVVSDSFVGLLAGLAIPFVIERATDRQDLIRERDRAQALLAEVQRGRESEAQAVALQERGRIAREMHDVLAHSLAGLSVQLQAIRAVATRENAGAAVIEPLDRAATLAREGLAEARAAVSTLRDPVGLGVDDLPALVERHPGDATFDVHGEPGRVSAEAGHAIYRAVQESLTNAARYAPGSPVEVDVDWSADDLVVTVRDHGARPGREAVVGQGTGLGLAGMGERLEQAGGTVQAGPDPEESGWRVRLRVPVSTRTTT